MKKPVKSDVDVLALLVKLQEQVAALDKKLDLVISRPQTPVAPRPQQQVSHPQGGPQSPRPQEQRPARPMYKIVCADCKKESEIPFKPSGDRPVYCKECFAARKSSSRTNPSTEKSHKAVVSAAPSVVHAAVDLPEPPAKDKKRPTASRKPAARKSAAKKKK